MTISSTNRKAGPYAGNDVAVDFPFYFKVFSTSDVLVVEAGENGTETTLTLDSDYTVLLNADQDAFPGGTVTLASALAVGESLVVSSDLENIQPVELTNNGGFYPRVINAALDRLTILVQQLAEKVARSLKMAITTPAGVDSQFPAPVPYALIGWNGDGSGFQNTDPTYSTALATDLASASNGKGGALVGFSQNGTGAAARTVDQKLKESVSAEDFFIAAETTATQMIQRAIDAVHAKGGGTVKLAKTAYVLGPSTLAETYDNFGSPVPASDGCLVLRSGVHLKGTCFDTELLPNSPNLSAILIVSPSSGGLGCLTIDSGWAGVGAGHGVFALNVAAGTDQYFKNYVFHSLCIKNVGSYGIGLQNGDIENVSLKNVRTYNTGADGIDIKNRGPTPVGQGISLKHIYIEKFGQRLDGCTGLDMRGRCNASHIYVKDVGRAGVTQTGIRMRALSSALDPAATYSTLDQYQVIGNGAGKVIGVETASPNTKVGAGFAISCTEGFLLSGNSDGHADYASVVGATAVNCTKYGFRCIISVYNSKFIGCSAVNCATGFRNEGENTLLVGCDAPGSTVEISTAAVSSPTDVIQACRFGANGYKAYSNSGRVTIEAMGSDTNVDLELSGKGSGVLRFGVHTANVDVPVTGYISIKDSGGSIRKLAVIA